MWNEYFGIQRKVSVSISRRVCWLFALCTALISNSATAQETLRIGVEEINYLPHYRFADGEFTGFAGEFLAQFAKDQNYRLDFRPLPVKRLLADLLDGAIDLKYPDDPTWTPALREGKEISYSDPVVGYVDGVMVPIDRVGRGLESIKTLGAVAGFDPKGWEGRIADRSVALRESRGFDALMKMVANGRLDAVYGNAAVMLVNAETSGLRDKVALDLSLPHNRGFYRLSTVKRPILIREVNSWMKRNEGWIQKLKAAYELAY